MQEDPAALGRPPSTAIERDVPRGRLAAALAVAVVADIIQMPVTLGWLTGIGGPIAWLANEGVDVITMAVLTKLVGFHWAFLPAFVIESVPFIDAAPTWTGSLLIAQRKRLMALLRGREKS